MTDTERIAALEHRFDKLEHVDIIHQREIEMLWFRVRHLEQLQGVKPENQIEMTPVQPIDHSFHEIHQNPPSDTQT